MSITSIAQDYKKNKRDAGKTCESPVPAFHHAVSRTDARKVSPKMKTCSTGSSTLTVPTQSGSRIFPTSIPSQGVLYLSMIRDLYDNSIVAYKTGYTTDGESGTGHHPSCYEEREKESRCGVAAPQRPRAFNTLHRAYFNLTQEYGITPSMSRRGNCHDNAMAENFFSILKTECIYRQQTGYIPASQMS